MESSTQKISIMYGLGILLCLMMVLAAMIPNNTVSTNIYYAASLVWAKIWKWMKEMGAKAYEKLYNYSMPYKQKVRMYFENDSQMDSKQETRMPSEISQEGIPIVKPVTEFPRKTQYPMANPYCSKCKGF